MKKRSLVLSLIATGSLLFAACGGDDTSADTAGADTTAADGSADATTAAPDDTSASDISIDEGKLGDIVGDDCAQVAAVMASVYGSAAGVAGDSTKELEAALDSMKSKVPDDLKDDLAVVSEAWSGYLAVLAKYGNDMTKLITAAASDPELQAQMAKMSTPEVEAASDNLSKYFDETCKTSD